MNTENKLEIHGVKILKGKDRPDVKINYTEYFEAENAKLKVPGEFDRLPHKDFKDAMARLNVHLGLLSGLMNYKQVDSEKIVAQFHVRGVTFTGDKNKGFVLSGSWDGPQGLLNFNWNNILFGGKTLEEYQLTEELTEALMNVRSEAAAYVRGKHQVDPNQELPFGNATSGQVLKPVMFAEKESETADLYGKEPSEVLNSTGKIPPADPAAMERVKGVTSVADVAAQIVNETNSGKGKGGRKKVVQSAENPSGETE